MKAHLDMMTDQVNASGATPDRLAFGDARPLVVLLVAANLAYPFALEVFFVALGPAAGGSLAATVGAAFALAAAFATPALGFAAILRLGAAAPVSAAALRARRLAHFSVAAPPLYTATGVLLITADLPGRGAAVWSAVWLTALAVLLLRPAAAQPPRSAAVGTPPPWLRWGHGLAAAAVLFGFVALHLGNHLLALAGADLHAQAQQVLRLWYRAPVVEPILVGLMLWLIGSGIALARHRTLSFTDRWGALQTASGAYLGAFLLSHMTAALVMARAKFGIDTTWSWAAGAPAGLLGDPWSVRLVPHYLLAVAAITAHAACGLRIILLAHGRRRATADAAAIAIVGGGALLALTLVAALLGARL